MIIMNKDLDKNNPYESSANILEEHLEQHGEATEKEARDTISQNIELLRIKSRIWERMRGYGLDGRENKNSQF